MSFAKLKEAELREVAEEFGVDTPDASEGTAGSRAATLRKSLEDDGVTWEMWQDTLDRRAAAEVAEAGEDEVEEVPTKEEVLAASKAHAALGNKVLVKMERANPRYDTQGFTFTKDHPYVLMSAEKAQQIFDYEEGFRVAQPREVEEFYG